MKKPLSTQPKHVLDNRADQLNPQHPKYYLSRSFAPEQSLQLATKERERLAHR